MAWIRVLHKSPFFKKKSGLKITMQTQYWYKYLELLARAEKHIHVLSMKLNIVAKSTMSLKLLKTSLRRNVKYLKNFHGKIEKSTN